MQRTASPVRRIEAGITTAIPIMVYLVVGSWLLGTLLPLDAYFAPTRSPAWVVESLQATILILPPMLWLVINGGFRRATYGMRQRGIRFANMEGERLAIFHSACRVLTGLMLLPTLPISLVLMVVDKQHRSLADMLCGTKVIEAQ